jgi:hypothetical protein
MKLRYWLALGWLAKILLFLFAIAIVRYIQEIRKKRKNEGV